MVTTPTRLGSTAISGWTVISGVNNPGAGSVDLISEGNYAPNPTAPPGSQIVDLDGSYGYTANPAGGIQQVIMGLTSGNKYTLSFFYTNNWQAPGSSSSGRVTIDDLSVTFTHTGATATTPNYTQATYTFTATANNVLSFASADPAGDYFGIWLSNVSIPNQAVVPEPASFIILGVGILTMCVCHRTLRLN